jgi:hypothetical protein
VMGMREKENQIPYIAKEKVEERKWMEKMKCPILEGDASRLLAAHSISMLSALSSYLAGTPYMDPPIHLFHSCVYNQPACVVNCIKSCTKQQLTHLMKSYRGGKEAQEVGWLAHTCQGSEGYSSLQWQLSLHEEPLLPLCQVRTWSLPWALSPWGPIVPTPGP